VIRIVDGATGERIPGATIRWSTVEEFEAAAGAGEQGICVLLAADTGEDAEAFSGQPQGGGGADAAGMWACEPCREHYYSERARRKAERGY